MLRDLDHHRRGAWALLVLARRGSAVPEAGDSSDDPGPPCPPSAGEAGRHLHLPALRAHGREAHRLHPGGQEPQEDGRGRPFRCVQGCRLPLGGSSEPAAARARQQGPPAGGGAGGHMQDAAEGGRGAGAAWSLRAPCSPFRAACSMLSGCALGATEERIRAFHPQMSPWLRGPLLRGSVGSGQGPSFHTRTPRRERLCG